MKRFEFVARSGAKLDADYVIENGVLHVAYRGASMSVAAGVNEIANAFLRDNLMRSITGEIDVASPSDAEVTPRSVLRGP
jgi:hypothetical protein